MLVTTPDKYKSLKDPDVRRSYQQIIHMILDFKENRPQCTKLELQIFTNGVLRGRKRGTSSRV